MDNPKGMMGLLRDQIALGQQIAVEKERTRLLAFVRAEREQWQAQVDKLDGYDTSNYRLTCIGRVRQCDTFIAWLENQDDKH